MIAPSAGPCRPGSYGPGMVHPGLQGTAVYATGAHGSGSYGYASPNPPGHVGGMPPRANTMLTDFDDVLADPRFHHSMQRREIAPVYGVDADGYCAGRGWAVAGLLRFHSASSMKQHPIKQNMGMIEADAVEESPALLGVCDGVSEVQKLGISPDEFPRELLAQCREILDARQNDTPPPSPRWWPGSEDPRWLVHMLEEAYDATTSHGSSTVLLAAIEDSNRLVVAQLGDCGLLVLRPTPSQPERLQLVFRTEPLRYDENKPYQVARLDGISEATVRSVIQRARIDSVPVCHGDIVIMGSDGIFDNLHEEECVSIIERCCVTSPPSFQPLQLPQLPQPPHRWSGRRLPPVPSTEQLALAAKTLVDEALGVVCVGEVNKNGHIQWPKEARQTPVGLGGKADDTTALVACLVMVDDLASHEEHFYKMHPSDKRGMSWMTTTCCGTNGSQPACERRNDGACSIT